MRIMWYWLFLLSIWTTTPACSDNNGDSTPPDTEHNYVISGTIANAAGRQIKLQVLPIARPGQQQQTVILDTATLSNAGQFTMEGTVEHPIIGVLTLDNQHTAYILIDAARYRFDADYNNWKDYELSGHKGSLVLTNFLNNLSQQVMSIRGLQQQTQQARKAKDAAAVAAAQQAEYDGLDRYYNYLATFADTTTVATVALYAGDIMDINIDREKVEALVNKYRDTHAESPYWQRLEQKLESGGHPLIGQTAPDIRLPNPQGDTMALSDLRGRYVLLDFWAAWCGPCRRENPNVVKLYEEYQDDGFTVFSVSLDKTKANWVAAIEQDGLVWDNHVSELAFWQTKAIKPYGVRSIPATFLLDPEGTIIANNLRGYTLERKLSHLLEE